MTENKRFTMDNPNDWDFSITDNVTGKVYNCASNILMKELCVVVNTIVEENEQLKQQLKEFKDYVFSDDEILCYSCVNCISKGIYEVECSVKGKVDVHGKCFSYWKDEVESRSD